MAWRSRASPSAPWPKTLRPCAVEQAEVDVEAAAAQVLERLGHEGGALAAGSRRGLDQALEQDGLVGRADHVGPVAEVQLVLAGRVLGERGLDRHVLRRRVLLDQGEEALLVLEPVGQEDLDLAARRRPGGGRVRRWGGRRGPGRGPAGGTRARARRRGVRPSSAKRPATLRSRWRGSAKKGVPSASRMPPSTWAPPGRQGTGRRVSGSRTTRAVGIALLPDDAAAVDVGAGAVERVERDREEALARQRPGAAGRRGRRLPRRMPLRSGRRRSTLSVSGCSARNASAAVNAEGSRPAADGRRGHGRVGVRRSPAPTRPACSSGGRPPWSR